MPPPYARALPAPSTTPGRHPELKVVVSDEAWATLEHVAQAQGVPLETLVQRDLAAYASQLKAELAFEPIGFGMWADRPEMQEGDDVEPVELPGKPLSEIILEDRR